MKDHMWATLGHLPQTKVAESHGKKLFKESQHLEADDIDIFDGEGDAVDMDANAMRKSHRSVIQSLTGLKASRVTHSRTL